MVFSLEKIFLSDEEIIPFERDAPKLGQMMLQYKLCHFKTSDKPHKWPI